MTRHFWVLIHRWAGLSIASFLIVAGLTGSLLAFLPELERAINPQFYPERASGEFLDLAALAERAERLAPEANINGIVLRDYTYQTQAMVGPKAQNPDPGFDQLFLDPYNGEELGRRQAGAISEGLVNLMPFIYQLHYCLALDSFGMWVLGICALAWTLDCFVAFYLTLPRRRKLPPPPHAVGLKLVPFVLSPSATLKRALSKDERNKRTCMKLWPFALSLSKHELLKSSVLKGQGGVSWWRRWKPAWKIRWNKGGYKLNFDLHRAGGLWLWVVLLIFAWSSVGMNLWDTVYTWATRAVFEYKTLWTELPERAEPLQQPRLSWREAQTRGEQLMAELAEEHGFAVDHANALRLDRTHGVYVYQVRSSLDFQDSRRAATQVFFDAGSGEFKLLMLPSGQYTGNTVTQWLYALHTGTVFGLPYRIFVCFLGVIIVMLSITGIVIWMKKRRARRLKYLSANRRAEALGEHV